MVHISNPGRELPTAAGICVKRTGRMPAPQSSDVNHSTNSKNLAVQNCPGTPDDIWSVFRGSLVAKWLSIPKLKTMLKVSQSGRETAFLGLRLGCHFGQT